MELIERLRSETPAFFKKLFIYLATLTTLSGSLTLVGDLPEPLNQIAKYVAVAGAVGTFMSRLPKVDTETKDEVVN